MNDLTRQIAGLSEEKRRLLELMLAREGVEVSRAVLAPRRWGGQPAPLSPGQRRLWLIDRIEPGSAAYNMPAAFRLHGRLDAAALARTVTEIVRRHEVLRTTFAEGPEGPEQRVAPPAAVAPPVADLAALPQARREAEAARLLAAEARRSFDLARGPVLRALLVRLAADEHRALLNVHHVASDGWSAGVLVRELTALYASFAAGRPSPLEPLPIQYRDFAAWQREWLEGERSGEALAWWRGELAGAPPLLELPTDRPRAAGGARPAGTLRFALPQAAVAPLRRLAEQEGATLFSLLLGAFGALLARWSGQDDVVVGTPVAGRSRVETEPLIGFFVSSLPVRVRLGAGAGGKDGEPGLRELLRRTAETVLAAHSHQELPFETLVEELAPERSLAHAPLFQVMFSLDNTPGPGAARLPGLELAPLAAESGGAKYDLTLTVTERGDGLAATLVYDRGLFDAATAERLAEHYRRLLAAAAEAPDRPLAELSLLSERERRQVTEEWTGAAPPYPREASLAALFAERAAAHPEAPALAFGGTATTYRELDAASAALAAELVRLGVGRGTRVGLCAERSPEAVAGMLAVVRAGGAYVPLDPSYPAERLAFMLEDTAAPVVLVQPHLADRLPADGPPTVPLALPEPGEEPAGSGAATLPPPASGGGDDLAYVIFTSGSTGRPKGVAVPQRAVARLVLNTDYVTLGSGARVGFASNLSFDAATFEVWGALLTGGCLVEVPREVALVPDALVRHLRATGVSHMFLTTSLFNAVAREIPDGFATLDTLLVGGEANDPASLRRVLAAGPPRRLLNGYGPTESTTFAVTHPFRQVPEGAAALPIGHPIANTRAWVVDRRLRPVPPGVAGELVLGGDGLAWGYLGRPALTAERFVPQPFGGDGERVYRTGDRARWLPGGTLEFLGRFDDQVKIRGFRIEPGEVEAALAADPEVGEAAVVVRGEAAGRRLVGYLVPRDGGAEAGGLAARVRGRLEAVLPGYMVPSALVVLDALPLTPNGKVDRRALPAPEDAAGEVEHVAPRTATEAALARLWQELLGVERVGVHDDFFALGGHSLLATRVVARARETFGVELPVRRVFEAPTVAALAHAVEEASRAVAPPMVPVPRNVSLPLSFAQERLWFLDRLEPGGSTYNVPQALRLGGVLPTAAVAAALTAVVARHEVLRTVYREGLSGAVQLVRPPVSVPLPVVDLSALPPERREPAARRLAAEEADRPFDLTLDLMLRSLLVRVEAEDHLLLTTMHHVASDGWSVGVLVREMGELMAAALAGRPARLPALPVQYADFAAWQRRWLAGETLEAEIAWWKRHLAGVPPVLELPTDRPRPPVASQRGAVETLRLAGELPHRVRELARNSGATPFMVLLAVFQALLGRLSGQRELAVGMPVAGRTRAEIENLIGFFVNTLVVRGDLAGDPGLAALVARVRETTLEAHQHQEVPFERLVEELAPERSLAHAPLLQVLFVLQNAPVDGPRLPGLEVGSLRSPSTTAKFDLTLIAVEAEDRVGLSLEYARDLFDAATARTLLERFERLLAAGLAAPERPVGDLPLLSQGERVQVLRDWPPGAAAAPAASIPELFAAQAAARPDEPALLWPAADGRAGGATTYGELAAAAHRLARHLAARGVGLESRVGVALPRSPELVTTLLAVLEAGGAYVPLDPAYPRERLAYMLADAGVEVLVTRDGRLAELAAGGVEVIDLAAVSGAVAAHPAEPLGLAVPPDALAYVLYTSGSTGVPKGVAVPHRAVARLVRGADFTRLDAGTTFLQLAPVAFDASTLEIWGPLANGGRLAVPPPGELSLAELEAWIAELGVTHLWLTAGLFHLVADERPRALAPLAELLAGGDVLSPAHVARVRRELPGLVLTNGYGPTENTTFTACQRVGEVDGPVPIGRPIAGTTVYVVDPALRPVPPGVAGELVTGGAGLARGYLGSPALTAERFVPDPFAGQEGAGAPGGRLYRTGDRARWLPGGVLEFLGRLDTQVKVRGFRVEPGEVEAALVARPEVREAVVVARDDGAGAARLVAYVVRQEVAEETAAAGGAAAADDAVVAEALRAALRERLPEHLVPSAVVVLRELPLTPNGKVDRRALPAPEAAGEGYVAPRTPEEEALAAIWAEVLGVPRVGARDDFFALGGHSLLATRLVARVRESFGVELPVRAVFETPTVEALARTVAEAAATAAPPLVPVPRDGGLPLSFAQERLWFLDRLEPGRATYNVPQALRLEGAVSLSGLAAALTAVAARHEVLRTVFRQLPAGPVQVVRPPAPVPVPLVDLAALPEEIREREARRLARAEALRAFDLAADPMLRAALVRLDAADHLLLATLHHVASDGWSVRVLVDEVAELLAARDAGRAPVLPDLAVQYADFAAWQRRWLAGPVLDAELAWWRERLAGLPPVIELPLDRPRPPVASGRGAVAELRLGPAAAAALRGETQATQVTPFMVMLAAWQALLALQGGLADVVVGVPVAGRTRAEIEPLIGFFVNTLVVRGDLSDNPTWRDLLERVREAAVAVQQHQDVPFERLVEDLAPQRSLAHAPLVQVSFALQTASDLRGADRPALGAAQVRALAAPGTTAKFDLALVAVEEDDGVRLALEYATDLFESATARRMLERYGRLLEAALAAPQRPLAELPLLAAAERRMLLDDWSRGPAPVATAEAHLPVPRQVLARAAAAPAAPAVVEAGGVLAYGELVARAGALAAELRRLGVGPERRVAVFAGRGHDLAVAQLGVLLAGGAYVPIDPDYPPERVAFQLADAAVDAVVAASAVAGRLPEVAVPVLAPPLAAPEATGALDAGPALPEHCAYVLYTSGSTGRPKGVEVTHGALANLAAWHRRRFAVDAAVRATLLASPAFDASVWELWPYLAAGAAVVAVADELRAAPAELARWLAAEGVTHAFLPTVLGEEVLPELPRDAALRVALLGGEALRRRPPAGAAYETVNCYGPTENAVVATSTPVAAEGEGLPPIGTPLDGVEAHVLDRRGRLALPGVAGELALAGASLARGYLGRPARTAASFVPNPYGVPGSRLYRTGDLVRWREGGVLEFLGRIDQQVKVRGFRIEPGEIETVLRQQPGVRDGVVAVLDGPAGARLVAYVVPAGEEAAGAAERIDALRAALAARLPGYMVPSAFVVLPELPLTPNGKIDRAALPAPEDGAGSRPPETPTEEALAALWGELLGRERVGAGDDFFALGGHSLLATRLVLRLHEELGVELPVRRVFEAPVLADLAEAVDRTQQAVGAQQMGAPPLVPVPRDGELPLSFAQERLWFLDRLEPNRAAYNVPAAVPLPAGAGLPALAAALTRVAARHEVLRTVLPEAEGRPVQVVRPPAPVRLPLVDLAGLPAARAEAEARRVAAAEAARPFDLAADPMLRAALLRSPAAAGPLLLLTIHHVASDGWSMELLRREVEELVRAAGEGRPPRLPALPVQYADYAVWQRRRLSGELLDAELAWWRDRLAGLPPELDLLPDAPHRDPLVRRGATVGARGPAELAAGLHAVARGRGATLFVTLLAGFHALLGRWTGQRDLAVGVPVAGRDRPEVQSLVGFFVNTLVARADLAGEPGFAELVGRTRATMLELQAHQEVPFERLVEELAPSRRLGPPPLVQALCVLQSAAFESARAEGTAEGSAGLSGAGSPAAATDGAVAGGAKFDLTLGASETPDGLAFTLEFERGLFAPATARRFLDAYVRLLAAAVAEPERPVADLPLLSSGESEQVLRRWPGRVEPGHVAPGHVEPVPEASIPELFAEHAAARPGATALVWPGGGAMTYGELAAASHRLAHHLAARGVGLESRVGVALPRGPELVVALLAVLEAGASYVPLDPDYPRERLAYMLANGGIEVLVTRDGQLAELAGGDAARSRPLRVVDLAREADEIAARPSGPPGLAVPPEALAYVLYTSGSTGVPKGVAVPHGAVARLVRGADWSRLDTETTFLQLAPVAFDLSTLEMWGPLANGGCLAVPPAGELSLAELEGWIAELGVTHLWLTAGLFHLVVDERLQALSPLRELLAGGDVLSPAHVARVRRELPDLALTNGYGPTENTTFTSCHRVDEVPGAPTVGGSVPIGRPIAGTTVYVVDAALRALPPGVAGELVTGGAGLARGYLGRPALTAERFVPDPFSDQPGGRLYRTGDRARWLPGGVLEFLGRLDTQVKVRGFRVEPGEVEAALVALPAVREAVVVARDDGAGAARLVGYVVPQAPEDVADPALPAALQAALRERLPDFLVPSAVVLLAELPLNPNQKVDRRALPEPQAGDAAVAPRDELERELLAVWEEVLGRAVPGVEDDFFALGGHSLLAVRLLHRVRVRFGAELPLASLFTEGTVALQARRLRWQAGEGAATGRPGAAGAPVVVPVRGGEGTPFVCVHAIGGNVVGYHELARRLGRPFLGLQTPPEGPPESIEAMAERYVDALREAGATGPWHLGGWSMGALVAWEMARRLTAAGEEVALLALLEPPEAKRERREAMDEAAVVAAFARDLAGLGVEPAGIAPADLAGLPPEEALERLAAALGASGGDGAGGDGRGGDGQASGVDPALLHRLYRAFRGNLDAMAAYDAPPWEGRVELLLAAEGDAAVADLLADETRGWGERAAEAGVHRLPGSHYTWLRPPAVGAWAGRLAALAAAADASGGAAAGDLPVPETDPPSAAAADAQEMPS